MMEKPRLRGADLVTAVILIAFGAWVLYQAFQMPMKDSFGGVMNVWYVSPALLPLIIGAGIMALATSILVHALKEGGAAALRQMLDRAARKRTARAPSAFWRSWCRCSAWCS